MIFFVYKNVKSGAAETTLLRFANCLIELKTPGPAPLQSRGLSLGEDIPSQGRISIYLS